MAFISSIVVAISSGSFVLSILATEWAAPINTALLVVLAFLARQNGKKIVESHKKIDNAALAAAHAAAAAADAARVAKDIGGVLRTTESPRHLEE